MSDAVHRSQKLFAFVLILSLDYFMDADWPFRLFLLVESRSSRRNSGRAFKSRRQPSFSNLDAFVVKTIQGPLLSFTP